MLTVLSININWVQAKVLIKEPVKSAIEFDAGFLQPLNGTSTSTLDLKIVTAQERIGAGTYPVIIRLNQHFFDHRQITFSRDANSVLLRPCLSSGLLREMGIKLEAYHSPVSSLPACVDLEQLISSSMVSFDTNHLTLDISVPQIAVCHDAAETIDPLAWDQGINAALLNYQLLAAQGRTPTVRDDRYASLYLQGGVNVSGWRFRSSTTLRRTNNHRYRWQRFSSYAQHDLPGTLGTLTLGEHFTSGDLFEALPFRGIQLSADQAMLPPALQSYAPIIRGIANSSARVDVYQNGYVIYSTLISPGPFAITDLKVAAGSGELKVVITEDSGGVVRFTQPFAMLPHFLHEKIWHYSATYGRYQGVGEVEHPLFGQLSLARGLPADITLYGGVLGSGRYQAANLGAGRNFGVLGALSLDITSTATQLFGQATLQGQSYRLRYAKSFLVGTSVRLTGYRYSVRGYRDFSEAVAQQQGLPCQRISKRARTEVNIGQGMGRYGSLYLTLSHQSYWGVARHDQQLQFGFSTQHRGVSYALNASRARVNNWQSAKNRYDQLAFNLSIPLGKTGDLTTYGTTYAPRRPVEHRVALSGYTQGSHRVAYNINASHTVSKSTAGSVSLGYRAPWAQLGASTSIGKGYQRVSATANGALLVHAKGIQWGHTVGETVALIEVPNTPNVGIRSAPSTLTDRKGYAVLPYMNPYGNNRVVLETGQLDAQTDVQQGVVNVSPRRGAVVKITFPVSHCQKVLLNVRLAEGGLPPFGALVQDVTGAYLGVVGQAGRILMTLGDKDKKQPLMVKWGEQQGQQCRLQLSESTPQPVTSYRVIDTLCHPLPDINDK